MKALLILMLSASSIIGYSQLSEMQVNANDLMSGSNMVRSFDNRNKDVRGFPTLLKSYYPGQVLLSTGVSVNQDSINLDVYHNDLLVKKGKDVIMVVTKAMVNGFTMKHPDQEMNFTKLRDPMGNDLFFEVLVKGKLSLYKRTSKTISGPGVDDGYGTGRQYSIYVQSTKIFIQKEKEEMVELKNKKVILSQFPDKEELINTFMKENKLGVKDDDELKKVVEYINTL
ncbi:MAG TPA: hypothetical protein VFU05_15840 [Cyclobacteriaceae bacterium]|nr:hypothetical protein [Cyclobacteriaceae bacterium]